MGDHATHLAQMTISEEQELFIPFVERISEMALLGATMIRKAVEAFIEVKSEKAMEVAAMDDQMDAARDALNASLYSQTQQRKGNETNLKSVLLDQGNGEDGRPSDDHLPMDRVYGQGTEASSQWTKTRTIKSKYELKPIRTDKGNHFLPSNR